MSEVEELEDSAFAHDLSLKLPERPRATDARVVLVCFYTQTCPACSAFKLEGRYSAMRRALDEALGVSITHALACLDAPGSDDELLLSLQRHTKSLIHVPLLALFVRGKLVALEPRFSNTPAVVDMVRAHLGTAGERTLVPQTQSSSSSSSSSSSVGFMAQKGLRVKPLRISSSPTSSSATSAAAAAAAVAASSTENITRLERSASTSHAREGGSTSPSRAPRRSASANSKGANSPVARVALAVLAEAASHSQAATYPQSRHTSSLDIETKAAKAATAASDGKKSPANARSGTKSAHAVVAASAESPGARLRSGQSRAKEDSAGSTNQTASSGARTTRKLATSTAASETSSAAAVSPGRATSSAEARPRSAEPRNLGSLRPRRLRADQALQRSPQPRSVSSVDAGATARGTRAATLSRSSHSRLPGRPRKAQPSHRESF